LRITMTRKLLEARRKIPKSFKLPNGVRVDFTSKRDLLGQFSDFKFNLKNGYDVSDMEYRILTKNFKEIHISEDDYTSVNPSEIKSIIFVHPDGYVISDIDDVEFRDTRTDEPVVWEYIQLLTPHEADNLELYFK
jgi:hypothetical protein